MLGPLYENKEDRVKQAEAVEIIRQNMPQRVVVETPEIFRCNHDFVILNMSHQKVGAGEVKCRNYPAKFFEKNPWVMDVTRIESLYHQCEKVAFKVMLVLYTEDKRVFWVALRDVLKAWDTLKPAPDSMMTDNHGQQACNRKGILIPFEMLKEVKPRSK